MVRPYEPLYTVKEASKVLKTSPHDVYALIKEGRLKCLILGSKKIRGSDLEHFIETYPTIVSTEGGNENA